MGGPGGGPDLTESLVGAQTIIMQYVGMVMPYALGIMAVMIGIMVVKNIMKGMVK